MKRKAFTFIEVMLVTVIFATISMAVFSCFSSGLKLWQRGKEMVLEEDALLFLDRFSSDLRNAFSFSKLSFVGKEFSLEFPSIVFTQADRVSVRADEEVIDQIGKVKYWYDPERSLVFRAQANYSQALSGNWEREQVMTAFVKSFRLHYFYGSSLDPHTNADLSDSSPAGVEVVLTIFSASGKSEKEYRRFISIPSGV